MAEKMSGRPLLLIVILAILLYGATPASAEEIAQPADSTEKIVTPYQLGHAALEDKKFDVAEKYLEQAAAAGDAKAQYTLAVMYDEGLGVKYDMNVALNLYTKAAAQGHEKAKTALKRMPRRLYLGSSAPRTLIPALYRALDEVEDTPEHRQFIADATYELGFDSAYAIHGESYDYPAAHKWFNISAQHGRADAEWQLGLLYSQGLGVLMDRNEALRLYEMSAVHGSIDAQAQFGRMYMRGWNIKKDYKLAYYWLKKAAKNGDMQGAFILGALSEKGLGTKQSYQAAAYWYAKVINNPYALYQLGMLYEQGKGVTQSYKTAIEFYKKSANDFAGSALRLGDLYTQGKGVEQNYPEAISWYKQTVSSNPDQWGPTASWHDDVGGDFGILEPYPKAIVHWIAEAQYKLGTLYEHGSGVPADSKEAVKWYLKSANAGNCPAMVAMGRINLDGIGRDKNISNALFWYSLATDAGNMDAAQRYLALQPEINDQQYRYNESLLADWAAKSSYIPLVCE